MLENLLSEAFSRPLRELSTKTAFVVGSGRRKLSLVPTPSEDFVSQAKRPAAKGAKRLRPLREFWESNVLGWLAPGEAFY
mmetsp:Transcript_77570/g.141982  ORF Transcript_77570/g.141982 Transcript_77570/m.141982 type:complete len:80 (-) Transcript_77570:431-670(-)|eukprot:4685937-Prorocentrum_lima.AAC.1